MKRSEMLQDRIAAVIAKELEGKSLGGGRELGVISTSNYGPTNNGCVRLIVIDEDGEPEEGEVVVAVLTFGKD